MKMRLIGCLVLGMIGSCLFAEPAFAATNQGPNPDDFSQSFRYGNDHVNVPRYIDYVVATSAYNYIPETRIKIFMPSPSGTIVINNHNICYATFRAGGRNYDTADDGNRMGSAGNAVSYTINGVTQWGAWDGAANCDNKSISFPVSGATLDPDTGMYVYILTATANWSAARYMQTFWVVAPAGSIVSQDSSLSGVTGFGMNQSSPIPGNNPSGTQDPPAPYRNYSNWSIKFAPDCSVTTPTVSRTIETYDDDNNAASPGDNWAVQPRRFRIKLEEFDRAGVSQGAVIPSISFPDGSGAAVDVGGGFYEVFTSGSNRRAWLQYTFKRDMVYQWILDSVYQDNTLQFKIPFDNIYYYRPCQLPGAQLKAGMAPSSTMAQGDTTTFTPSLMVSGYRGAPFTANCTIRRTLYPPSGGTSDLGAQPCVDVSGSANIAVSGGGIISLRPNTYTAAAGVLPGTRICDRITITSPSAASYFAAPADREAEACVVIVKTPLVHFMGGDVWAGGGFTLADGTCPSANANIVTTARSFTIGAATYTAGSAVEFAAFALGTMTEFGSASKALLAANNNVVGSPARALAFANTAATAPGSFAATQHCLNDHASDYASAPVIVGSANFSAGDGAWHATGNLTMGGVLPAGTQQVYLVDGDVTITNSIHYKSAASPTYGSVDDIPSLVVIARGNIRVDQGVSQLDGVFITRGTFFTCYQLPTPATVNTCNNKLTVNGAVVATNLNLYRTAGAGGATAVERQQPAELFQLSPEVYLRNALNRTSTPIIRVTERRELPPRF